MNPIQTQFRASQIAADTFIAAGVIILGDVTVHSEASIWFNSVIRGDTERIEVGEGSNIQDLCMLHADPGFPCIIGKGVTVGHRAIIHGATLHDNCLIGMGAILLNGSVIGSGSIIGAGAVVSEGKHIPPGSLVLGVPGKVIKPTSEAHRQMIAAAAEDYRLKAQAFRQQNT